MAISESQLETWSNQGAIAIAKSTHESIRNAILSDSKLKDRNFEVYLQGSYRNSTNTWGDSDVDVVIQLSDVFVSDTSSLTENQRTLFRIRYSDSTYHWEDFRSDVLKALREYYGEENIDEGNKSLKLKKTPGRLAADIVPCLQYRLYHPCSELTREDYTEGIWFRERDNNRSIVNYPKEHYNNGVNKNSDEKTGGLFKPIVRLFKNVRAYPEVQTCVD